MAVTHGMNIGEVRDLGYKLKAMQDEIQGIINRLNAEVNSTTWVGPDATEFKGTWWPEHSKRLRQMGVDLDGFGQSALNNAQAQEDASGR